MRIKIVLAVLALLTAALPSHAQFPFIGQIDIVGFNFAPVGWEPCDGRLLPISEFSDLFNLIGTTYGGDGESTFALPDLRGRMAIGQGQGPGMAPHVIGQAGGEEQLTLTVNQIPVHSHPVFGTTSAADALGPGGTEWATTSVFLYSSTGHTLVPMNIASMGLAGGGLPHDNLPPYLVMNFIIAVIGVFPVPN